uniref:MutL_C domain-containing protein n=1 Tax=Mesocestoides corti TaxID=53468 RepID=A0A5K3FE80_MESCO
MSRIRALDSDAIRKLCSSQVVVTLGIAIKELVENAIDAGAKKVEIKLKNYGCDSIEVIDDGCGISEDSFETLGKKHSTSKIQDFGDIVGVTSFGFRGEALHSLCQVADVAVHTRAESARSGTRLEFSTAGEVKSRRPLARSKGTTVVVDRLFHTLPVRRRHLTDQSRLLKEFTAAVSLISGYCVSLVGVQLACYRFDKKGTKTLVVSNMSARSVSENIAAVFGQAQLDSLVEIASDFPLPSELINEFNVKLSSEELDEIRVSGYISAPPTGASKNTGRSSADRQFVCINGRPCDFPQLTRLATDVWRRCCRECLAASSQSLEMPSRSTFSGFPVLVLNIQLPRAKVDVNLSPDKRQLLLHWERPVVMKVKAALVATLGCNDGQQSLASISNLGDSNTFVEGGGEGCSPVRSLQLTQQPLISPHLTITPSTPEARSSPQLAKRPRLSMPVCQLQTTSPSTPSARKSIFASDSARKTYDNNLPILNRRRIDVNFSLERLHRYWMSQDEPAESTEVSSTGCFHAGLTESSAESELTTLFKSVIS